MGEIVPDIKVVNWFPSLDMEMPGRVYIFPGDSTEYDWEKAFGSVDNAIGHYRAAVTGGFSSKFKGKFDWVTSVMWGHGQNRMIDFFGYKLDDPNNWQSNSGFAPWITRNGELLEDQVLNGETELTCGRGGRIIGAEETYRLTTPNGGAYLSGTPNILGLAPMFDPVSPKRLREVWDGD